MKHITLLIVCFVIPLYAFSETIEVGGIYYNFIKGSIVEVTKSPNKYSGNITIPSQIDYNGQTLDVKIVGDSAFYESQVESVILTNGIQKIGKCAFSNSDKLKKIEIPETVIDIEYRAFGDCKSLVSIKLPSKISTLSSSLFISCINLQEVNIPENVVLIDTHAFYGCKKLKSITIPKSVEEIDTDAFRGSGLEAVYISDLEAWCMIKFSPYTGGLSNPVTIAHHLYLNEELFVDFIIPANITNLSGTFKGCSDLQTIKFHNNFKSLEGGTFWGCNGLKEIYVPNNVEKIGSSDFKECENLSKVYIGSGINKIGFYAFEKCKNLSDLYCYAKDVPKTEENAFLDSYIEYATLHVPAESLEKYKAHSVFGKFGNIVALTDTEMSIHTIYTPQKDTKIYTLNGVQHKKIQKGLNIIQSEDGKTKKIFIK